ncbi:hypothetical protein GC175_32695 [bacterium]|nr:hypothetical protein [bacterium]
MRRQTDQHEIEDMQPVRWRPDGTPTKFEIVQREPTAPRPIGWDDAPIVAPTPADRLPRVQRVIEGSPVDEARAFNIRVSSLAAVLGGGLCCWRWSLARLYRSGPAPFGLAPCLPSPGPGRLRWTR